MALLCKGEALEPSWGYCGGAMVNARRSRGVVVICYGLWAARPSHLDEVGGKGEAGPLISLSDAFCILANQQKNSKELEASLH